jgi:hypothetical protein
VDASLLAVAQVIRDTGHARTGFLREPDPEGVFRQVLGGELLDKFFQLLDPQGQPNRRSARLGNRALSLSAEARRNATRGARTFETAPLPGGERVRVLTIPVLRDGRPVEFIQVGMSLVRVEDATRRFLQLLFVVNRGNVIGKLTLNQVRDIYTRRALRWTDVGGASQEPIHPLVRNPESGSAELFAKHVTLSPTGEAVSDRLIPTMMGVIDAVGSGPNDIGYTVYYYAKTFLEAAGLARGGPGPHFKLIAIDGVEPTDETIAKGTYRLRKPVYAVIRQDAPRPIAALHDWLSSADGQRVVSESGYLPILEVARVR